MKTQADCMAKVREILANPRPAGNWWANEVMQNMSIGKKVSMAAFDMAKAALAGEGQRVAGQDDEEAA